MFQAYTYSKVLKKSEILPLSEVFSYVQPYIAFEIESQTLDMIFNLNRQYIQNKSKQKMQPQFNNLYPNQQNQPPFYPQNNNNLNTPFSNQNIPNNNFGNYPPNYRFIYQSPQNPNSFNTNTNAYNNLNAGNQSSNLNVQYNPNQEFQNFDRFQNTAFNQNVPNTYANNNTNDFVFQNANQLPKKNEQSYYQGNTLNVNVNWEYFSDLNYNQKREQALKKEIQLKKKKERQQQEKRIRQQQEKRIRQEQERKEKEEETRDKQFEARKLQRQLELKQNEAQLNIFADNERQELDRGSGRFSANFGMKVDFGENQGEQFNLESSEQVNNSLLRFSKKPEVNQHPENKQ